MSKNKKIWTVLMLAVSVLVSVYFCFAIWNESKQIQNGVLVEEDNGRAVQVVWNQVSG